MFQREKSEIMQIAVSDREMNADRGSGPPSRLELSVLLISSSVSIKNASVGVATTKIYFTTVLVRIEVK
jgi:hypothetical protein